MKGPLSIYGDCLHTHIQIFLEMTNIDTLMDAKDVKRMLKVSLPLVYKWAEAGRLPCVRWECPGKGTKKPRTVVRFKPQDIYDFIERHYNMST